jgi:hypothetical protein
MRFKQRPEAIIGIIICFTLFYIFALGCVPQPLRIPPEPTPKSFLRMPVLPSAIDPELSSLEEVVNTKPTINRFVKGSGKHIMGATVGVMDFQSSAQTGSGTLVADTFSINLFRKNVHVVERQNIKKIAEEQSMAAQGLQKLSDEEIAKRIGQITRADFILFGAVTQYHFENRNLPVPFKVKPDEMASYFEKVRQFKKEAVEYTKQQEQLDVKFFEWVKRDLLSQLARNDTNRYLHYSGQKRGQMFEYQSAKNLQWNYSYFTSTKVLPYLGKSMKELDYEKKSLLQDKAAWEFNFNEFITTYDKTMTPSEYQGLVWEWSQYYDYHTEEKGKKDYDPQKYETPAIKKTIAFVEEVTEKLKEYYAILNKIKRCDLPPIPERESHMQLPPPQERFVSIANLGITFKIIDVKTGDIVWIGQASKRDLNIQKGLNEMIEAVVTDIITVEK